MSLALFFVADGPRLETQSWLLACTLAATHHGTKDVRLIAYAAPDHLPAVTDLTHGLYAATGVDLRPLPDPPQWQKPYPHGNKIAAACDDRGVTHSVFLDTDMVCCAPLTGLADLAPDEIAAAPEGKATWGAEGDRWARAYAHFDLPVPQARVRLLRGKRAPFLPYFNAGLVAFPEAPHASGSRFPELWRDTALDFDWNCRIGAKRPGLIRSRCP